MRPTLARPAQGGLVTATISTACSAERLSVYGLRSTPVGRRGCKQSWQYHNGLPLPALQQRCGLYGLVAGLQESTRRADAGRCRHPIERMSSVFPQ
jgi:hypothetical protein